MKKDTHSGTDTVTQEPERKGITLTFLGPYEYVEASHGARADLPLSAILQDALEGSGLTPDDAEDMPC